MSIYRFRSFTARDVPTIARWLREPEVRRWWGEPDEQLGLIRDDLDEPLMRQWIVEHQGLAFAYLQAYRANVWPQPHLGDLPAGTEGIDTFIGEQEMLGRGHGAAFLRVFSERLRTDGAPLVAIDPHPDNLRARRAYARAGFVEQGIVQTEDGPAVLMLFS